MRHNPRLPAPETPAPPAERGQRLFTAQRGQGEELRINLDEYNERPYVSARIWEKGSQGNFWPTRKGISIRIGELSDVIAALKRAEELVDEA